MGVLNVVHGAGLLCEPLARLGCEVVGVDATGESIEVARLHAREDPDVERSVTYLHTTVDDLVKTQGMSFDLVVSVVCGRPPHPMLLCICSGLTLFSRPPRDVM